LKVVSRYEYDYVIIRVASCLSENPKREGRDEKERTSLDLGE
jgi:hypothetical protein